MQLEENPLYKYFCAGYPSAEVEFAPTASKEMGINIKVEYHGYKKAVVEKFYEQKAQPVLADVIFADRKSNTKTETIKQRKKAATRMYEQQSLFGEAADPEPKKDNTKSDPVIASSMRKIEWHHSLKNFKVIITNSSGHEFRYHVLPEAQRGKFTKDYKQIKPNSPMAANIIGKQEGDAFEFGRGAYRIEI